MWYYILRILVELCLSSFSRIFKAIFKVCINQLMLEGIVVELQMIIFLFINKCQTFNNTL